jgi:Family of unknown function (DUF6232)
MAEDAVEKARFQKDTIWVTNHRVILGDKQFYLPNLHATHVIRMVLPRTFPKRYILFYLVIITAYLVALLVELFGGANKEFLHRVLVVFVGVWVLGWLAGAVAFAISQRVNKPPVEKDRSYWIALLIAVAGLTAICAYVLYSIFDYSRLSGIFLVLALAGLYRDFLRREYEYTLQLETTEGTIDAFTSKDEGLVYKVKVAIELELRDLHNQLTSTPQSLRAR